jgi:transcription elongation factor Elf1
MVRVWTDEAREKYSIRMKNFWCDPVVREAKTLAVMRPANCPDCSESDVTKFYQDKKSRRTNARCKECQKIHNMKSWHLKSPIEKQASRVSAMYGITPDEYRAMHERQNGKCAICNREPTTKRLLHVDHCHKTNVVRGLLCHGCNTAIGAMKENIETLRSAIAYLGG